MKEVQFKKHVRVICDLSIGDECMVEGFGYKLDGKKCVITDIEFKPGCESAFMVMIDQYDNWLDSNWITLCDKP